MERRWLRWKFTYIQSTTPCPKYMGDCYNSAVIHNRDRKREKKSVILKTCNSKNSLWVYYINFIFFTVWPTLRGNQQSSQQNGGNKERLVIQEQLLVFSSISWEFFTFSFSASPQMLSLLCASWVFTVQDYGGGGNILPIVQWRQWLRSQSLEGRWCLANVSALLLLHVPHSPLAGI